MTVATFSAALIVGMGFAAVSRAADLLGASAPAPGAAVTLAPVRFDSTVVTDEDADGVSSFAPALAIGVGVTGALARRRRAMSASAA